jgi:hypothetical protein
MSNPTAEPTHLPATRPAATGDVIRLGFDTQQGFEAIQRAAKMFSASSLVPKEYQGPTGISSCAIALDLAARIGASPLMVMQNLYIVHGRPGWGAKFMISTFNQCGRFSPIRYEFEGTKDADDWGCRAWAIEKATGEKLVGPLITIKMAKAEGWYSRDGSKWKTMPEQMLRYRSAAWFVNTVAPEVSMGLPTEDEVGDFEDAEVIETKATPINGKKDTAASLETTWEVADLEAYDDLLERAYVAFKAAGYDQEYTNWAPAWRTKRGKGDPKGSIRDLEQEVHGYEDAAKAAAEIAAGTQA